MRMQFAIGTLAAMLAAASIATRADTLTLGPALGPAEEGPERGSTMTEVERSLGPPERKSDPVGDPPISVWHYPKFNVYFEYDKVLHSVEQRK